MSQLTDRDASATSAGDAPELAFLRSTESDPPVTVVREIRVRRGSEPAFEDLMSRLIAEATRQPGHLGATVLRPDSNRPGDAHRFVYKFDRRSRLEVWHRSDARARLAAPIRELIESERLDAYLGLETWFELPGTAAPPRWKTTLMSWVVIYALVVLGSYALEALDFQASIPIRAFVLTALVVPAVSYVVAPWLGRQLHGWLYAGLRAGSAKRVRG
jgi:uncharacterized protein